ncbi:hypothetical protein [Streptomyces fungicidicus]
MNQEMDHGDGFGKYARRLCPGRHRNRGRGSPQLPAPSSQCVRERLDVTAELRAELPLWLQEGDEDWHEFWEGDEDWHEFWEDLDWEDRSPFQQQLVRYMERDLPRLEELRALADGLWPSGAGVVIGGYASDEVINSIAEQTLAGREKAGAIPAISATTTGPTPTLPSAARWRWRSGAPAWCGTTACATGNKRTLPGGLM